MNSESKVLVFVLFATQATYNPFFTLMMEDKGFTSAEQIGTIISATRFIALVSAPFVCHFAERRGIHRVLLSLLALSAAAIMLIFYFAVQPHQGNACAFVSDDKKGVARPPWCPVTQILPPTPDAAAAVSASSTDTAYSSWWRTSSPNQHFLVALGLLCLYSLCNGAKSAICDTLVLAACRGTETAYAHQRLFGSLSWGLVSLGVGVAVKYWSTVSKNHDHVVSTTIKGGNGRDADYSVIPLLHAAAMICLSFVLYFLFPAPPSERPLCAAGGSGDGFRSRLRHILGTFGVVAAKGSSHRFKSGDGDHDDDGDDDGNDNTSRLVKISSSSNLEHNSVISNRTGHTKKASAAAATATAMSSNYTSEDSSEPQQKQQQKILNHQHQLEKSKQWEQQSAGAIQNNLVKQQQQLTLTFTIFRNFFSEPATFFPCLGIACISFMENAQNNFLFPYMRWYMGAPPIIFGWIDAIHAVVEVGCFYLAERMLGTVARRKNNKSAAASEEIREEEEAGDGDGDGGRSTAEPVGAGGSGSHRNQKALYMLLTISAGSFAAKSIVYATTNSYSTVLLVEVLHGTGFAFMWAAAVAHLENCSQKFLNALLMMKESETETAAIITSAEETVVASSDAVAPATIDTSGGSNMHDGPSVAAVTNFSPSKSSSLSSSPTTAVTSTVVSTLAITSLWFVSSAVPPVTAGVISGIIVKRFGEVVLFQIIACVGAAVMLLFFVCQQRGYFNQ